MAGFYGTDQSAPKRHLRIAQGAYREFRFLVTDTGKPDGTPVNMTGWTLEGYFRRTPDSCVVGELHVMSAFPAAGDFRLVFVPADTLELELGPSADSPRSRFVYDVFGTPPNDFRRELLGTSTLVIEPVSTR